MCNANFVRGNEIEELVQGHRFLFDWRAPNTYYRPNVDYDSSNQVGEKLLEKVGWLWASLYEPILRLPHKLLYVRWIRGSTTMCGKAEQEAERQRFHVAYWKEKVAQGCPQELVVDGK